MEHFLSNLDTIISALLNSLGIYGPLLGSLLILVESIIPALPLSVFITLNFYAFGNLVGFIISYVLTVLGCNLAFLLSRKFFLGKVEMLLKKFDKNKLAKLVVLFNKIKFNNLVLLMAFPFTPAFLVNILSGTSKMEHKKFLYAAFLGKPFMVYFWGYIGVTLLESLKHPLYLLEILIILSGAYLIGTIINKKFNLD